MENIYVILRREVQTHPDVESIHVKTKWVDMAFSKQQAANRCLDLNEKEKPRVRPNDHGGHDCIRYYYLEPGQENNIDIVPDFSEEE